jgi:hypothetical protein
MVKQFYPFGTGAELQWKAPLVWDSSTNHAAQTNAACVVTLPADPARGNVIEQIWCSYSAVPAAGSYLQIEDGAGTVVWKQYLVAGGPIEFNISPPLEFSKNTATIVTLSNGGAAISGTLDVNAYLLT